MSNHPYEPPPDELMNAVREEIHPWDNAQAEAAIAAVPDGWAKLDGAWMRLEEWDEVLDDDEQSPTYGQYIKQYRTR